MDFDNNNNESRHKDILGRDITRKAIIDAEQPVAEHVEVLYDPHAPEVVGKNVAVMEQYDQANEPSNETVKLRNYKRRQMNEFTDNYLFSQVIPSRWVTIINVFNTFLLTVVLLIAFVVAFGLLLGLRIGLVPTDSMIDVIPVGSMVIMSPVEDISDIRIGDILSYSYGSADYIHQVKSVGGGAIVMVGANSIDPAYADLRHVIDFSAVKGRLLIHIPYLGYVVMFIQQYMILVIAVFLVLLIGLMLARTIIQKKHNDEEFKEFLDKKAAYELRAEQLAQEQKKKDEEMHFNNLMHQ